MNDFHQSTSLYLKGYKNFFVCVRLKKAQGLNSILAYLWSLPVLWRCRTVKVDMANLSLPHNRSLFASLEQRLLIRKISSIETDSNNASIKQDCAELKAAKENISQKKKDKCSICLGTLFTNKKTVITSCWHRFHDKCLSQWLNDSCVRDGVHCPISPPVKNDSCPVCRAKSVKFFQNESSFLKDCCDDNLLMLKAVHSDNPMITRKKYRSESDHEFHFLVDIALQKNSERTVRFLIEKEAVNIDSGDVIDALPLIACFDGNISIVRAIFNISPDLISKRYQLSHDNKFYSLIEIAIKQNDFIMIQFLIEVGINIHISDDEITRETRSLLFFYVESNHLAEFENLLTHSSSSDIINIVNDNGDSLLQVAICNGNVEMVEYLIKHGTNINSSSHNTKGSYLQQAVGLANGKIAELLINNGADTNALTDAVREAPLQLAIQHGRTEIVKLLLEHNANTDSINTLLLLVTQRAIKAQKTLLATQTDDINILSLLLQYGADANAPTDTLSYTPLQLAIQDSNKKIVKLMIKHHTDLNAASDTMDSPLQLAIQKNNKAITELLINNGANVNESTKANKIPPLQLAIKVANQKGAIKYVNEENKIEIVKLLISKGANIDPFPDAEVPSPLELAIDDCDTTIVRLLLQHKADANALTGHPDMPPLRRVLVSPRKIECYGEIITLLIDNGANINNALIDTCNSTPLQIAVRLRNKDILVYLLEHGADVNAAPNGTVSPFVQTIKDNNIEQAKALITYGADVNVTQDNNTSLLHLAIENKNVTMAELLITHGANVDAESDTMGTPLQMAIKRDQNTTIKLLIDNNANINAASNAQTHSPIELAIIDVCFQPACQQLVDLLINNGADLNSPLKRAIEMNKSEMARLLIKNGADINAVPDGNVSHPPDSHSA